MEYKARLLLGRSDTENWVFRYWETLQHIPVTYQQHDMAW
jgi:hypothetical protein